MPNTIIMCFFLFCSGNRPLDIFISFDIFTLSEFLVASFSYTARFLITLKWYDHRVEFANLKPNMFNNLIGSPEKDSIWIPPLIFNNSERNTMLTLDREPGEPRANILVEKLGNPRVAPPTILDETFFYKGSENLMVYRDEYNLKFNCIYELGYYPFDIQTCKVEVRHTFLSN